MQTKYSLFKSLADLNNKSALFWAITCTIVVLLLGVFDLLSGYELSFSIFYLAPISAASWFAGRRMGLMISIISTVTWLIADYESGNTYTTPLVTVWNVLIRLGFFVVVAWLLSELRIAYQKEQELARIDQTTGVANSRNFQELAQSELDHARRFGQNTTIAYIDIDNFKDINDRFGHARGDEVLRVVSSSVRGQLRIIDTVARLGGDEFALLLPGTDQAGAKTVISKLHIRLMMEMEEHAWPVTFSIGVVTFAIPPESVDAMIHFADEAMYSVKRDTKNGVRYLNHPA